MDLADRLRHVLEATPGVRLAVLFGSAAAGTAGARSDVDIGILLESDADHSLSLRVALERAGGRPIDLVPLDTAPALLRFEIARTGTVLLANDAHAWPDFKARAMIDWWDWAPTARLMRSVTAARLREEAEHGPG